MYDINKPENNPEFADTKCISPNLASDDYLQLMHLDFSDFEWKKVASIWWWFGILEMDLAKRWTDVEIIDPIYSSTELRQKKLDETYDWVKKSYMEATWHRTGVLEKWIENLKKEIALLLEDENPNIEKLYEKQQELEEKESQKKRKDKLLHNKLLLMKNLEDRHHEKPNNLILNPSNWEDIHGIDESSKDYVLINHLLHYFPDKINIFLQQADKILKDWWNIFIVEYIDELPELQEFFMKNWTYNVIWWTFCGSLKKWEFKDFWK